MLSALDLATVDIEPMMLPDYIHSLLKNCKPATLHIEKTVFSFFPRILGKQITDQKRHFKDKDYFLQVLKIQSIKVEGNKT